MTDTVLYSSPQDLKLDSKLLNLQAMLCQFCGDFEIVLADFLNIKTAQSTLLVDHASNIYPLLAYHKLSANPKYYTTLKKHASTFDSILKPLTTTSLFFINAGRVNLSLAPWVMHDIAKNIYLDPKTTRQGLGILWQIFDFFCGFVINWASLEVSEYQNFLKLQSLFLTPTQRQYQKKLNITLPKIDSTPTKTFFDNGLIPNDGYLVHLAKTIAKMPALQLNQALADKLPTIQTVLEPSLLTQTIKHKWAILTTLVFCAIGAVAIGHFNTKNMPADDTATKKGKTTQAVLPDVAIVRTNDNTAQQTPKKSTTTAKKDTSDSTTKKQTAQTQKGSTKNSTQSTSKSTKQSDTKNSKQADKTTKTSTTKQSDKTTNNKSTSTTKTNSKTAQKSSNKSTTTTKSNKQSNTKTPQKTAKIPRTVKKVKISNQKKFAILTISFYHRLLF